MVVRTAALQRRCCSKTNVNIEIHAGPRPLNNGLNKQSASSNNTLNIHPSVYSRHMSLTNRHNIAASSAHAVTAAAASSPDPPSATAIQRIAEIGTMMFPIWALISGAIAFFHPNSLNWMTTTQFEQGVGLLMLAMGLSLSMDDFRKCAANPTPILLGFVCQYSVLPLTAFTIAKIGNLPAAFATGLILLGSCPGGQASNVATFVARGDVALSVLMTTASTVAAAVMTPLLCSLLAGQFIPVDAWGLAESTARLVLLPTLIGVALNELFPKAVAKIRPVMPLLALLLTVVLCAVPVAQVADVLRTSASMAIGPVLVLHGCGYFLGYFLPRLFGFNEKTSRTVSIETGMQSAALAFSLSMKHFSDVMVSLPGAVSIVVMVWMGALLAAVWRCIPIKENDDEKEN
ncbi:hypothetical protein Ndes2526B_g08877 [Nannochloris sp. 'desiccata']